MTNEEINCLKDFLRTNTSKLQILIYFKTVLHSCSPCIFGYEKNCLHFVQCIKLRFSDIKIKPCTAYVQ